MAMRSEEELNQAAMAMNSEEEPNQAAMAMSSEGKRNRTNVAHGLAFLVVITPRKCSPVNLAFDS